MLDLPDDTLLLGAQSIANVLAISKRKTYRALDEGQLDVIHSVWRKDVLYRYAIVNERMRAWAEQHERWVPASRVYSSWFTREEMLQHTWTRRVGETHKVTYVFTGFRLLQFAAARMPESTRAAIAEGQVEHVEHLKKGANTAFQPTRYLDTRT